MNVWESIYPKRNRPVSVTRPRAPVAHVCKGQRENLERRLPSASPTRSRQLVSPNLGVQTLLRQFGHFFKRVKEDAPFQGGSGEIA